MCLEDVDDCLVIQHSSIPAFGELSCVLCNALGDFKLTGIFCCVGKCLDYVYESI